MDKLLVISIILTALIGLLSNIVSTWLEVKLRRWIIPTISMFIMLLVLAYFYEKSKTNIESRANIYKENIDTTAKSRALEKGLIPKIIVPILNSASIDLSQLNHETSKQIETKKLDLSERIALWDTILVQVRKVNINESNLYDFGKVSSERRTISDSYLACSKLLNQKSKFIIKSEILKSKRNEENIVTFINELGKPSLDLDCFVRNYDISRSCSEIPFNEQTDFKNAKIVNFRLRLGQLIYQHLFLLDNTIKMKTGDFASLFLPEERSSDNVRELWNYFKPIIFKLIDKKYYRSKSYDEVVNRLLSTHNYVYSKDYKSIFYLIASDKTKGELFNEYQDIPRLQSIEMNNFWGQHFTNWFYSFWYRRYIENTDEITFEILKEVANHYK